MTLRSAATGRYLTEKEDGSLVADQEGPNGWVVRETFILGPAGDQPGLRSLRSAATGTVHRFSWEVLRRGADAAAQAAAAADVCVIVVGNDPLVNGRETEDRATLALPPAQDRLIRAASAACPRSVLVVMSSYPYALGWAADRLPAIAWTSHAGQETGHALADVLLGTHARRPAHPDLVSRRRGPARPARLRHHQVRPHLPVLRRASPVPVRPRAGLHHVRLPRAAAGPGRAAGCRDGPGRRGDRHGGRHQRRDQGRHRDRPVLRQPVAPRRPRPAAALAGFTRLTLAPGETRTARIVVPGAALAYWDVTTGRMTVEPGMYQVRAASSSAGPGPSARLTVHGPPPAARHAAGTPIAAADFDDYSGDHPRRCHPGAGDAVTPAGPARAGSCSATWIWVIPGRPPLPCAPPGPARAGPGGCARPIRPTASCWPPSPCRAPAANTAGPRCSAPLHCPPGASDLYLVLCGPVRLAWFQLREHLVRR